MDDITRMDVLRAIREYDALGAREFLAKYKFGPARAYRIVFDGKRYDSKAIVGAAHGYATGEAWSSIDFSGGAATVEPLLTGLGFNVEIDRGSVTKPETPPHQQAKHQAIDRPAPAMNTALTIERRKPVAQGKRSAAVADQIKAEELPVMKVFSSDYDFRIPDYQRPYAWQVEHALQLLEDFEQSLRDGIDDAYFLGSLVLVRPPASQTVDVIDGQQRLTTLTIILAILRDLTTDRQIRGELEKFINEPGQKLANIPPRPRLQLRAKDNQFFGKYVQSSGNISTLIALDPAQLETDAQKSIRANTEALYTRLTTWDEHAWEALASLISTQTYLVIVTTADITSAYRIFSVMNARGLNLSPPDIFKSNIIGAMPAAHQSEYSEKWEDAEDDLSRNDFQDLFLHIRMIFAKERGRREILKEFRAQVLNQYLPDQPERFVDDVLIPYVDAYERILKQDYVSTSGADKVNNWLRRLVQLDNNDWRPPALWAMRHHNDDPQFLDQYFAKLERLAASMLIRRVYATPRSTRYADLLKQLEQGHGIDCAAFELSSAERKETKRKLNDEIYRIAPVRKYVLLRLDETLANSPGVSYDHKIITVEHVLPQNPSAGSPWLKSFTEDDRDYWTHRLANLVLLNRTKNSEAQNFSFSKKKAQYFTSKKGTTNFSLTSQVLSCTEWTPAVLETRQFDLTKQLTKLWSL
ncbi:DUF262 domain-containing protein [Mycolicibacterium mageritense]